MTEEISKVNILLFKNEHCFACEKVEPILRQIIASSRGSASLTIIDTDKEVDLARKFNVSLIPVVYYNDEIVLNANQAGELINGMNQSKKENFSLFNTEDDLSTDFFGNAESALFNHLFNQLIQSSIDSNAEIMERRQKFNMLSISQKTMSLEAIQNISRPALGDYVHIGMLQSIVTSILAINPLSSEYLYRVGRAMGRFGNVQYRFLNAFSKILENTDTKTKFRDIIEGLTELYSANSLGLPLYLVSKSHIRQVNQDSAILTVYDSAFCAHISPIGQPVCYLIAGEIAGLIEITLAEKVSVVETRCFGLGDPYCEFTIELDKERDFSFMNERVFLTESEKDKFQQCLTTISKNMYRSSLIKEIIRPGFSDYVHISVLQQTLNGIKFSIPFFSTLLFYAGLHYGKHGADFAVIERLLKGKVPLPIEFEDSLQFMVDYFNDPATILTRWQGNATLEIEDSETAYINIYESANASGLNMKNTDLFLDINTETTLCDFTAGFIQGRLSRLTTEKLLVTETTCIGLGSKYCSFKVVID